MDELERRLRSALTELADEVPPSHHAWAEHERRVAQRTKRARLRPLLMAVGAAAAVALIAVPVLLLNTRGGDHELEVAKSVTNTPSTSQTSPAVSLPQPYEATYDPAPGEQVLMPPKGLMGEQVGKESRTVYVFAVRRDNQNMLCIGQGPTYNAGPPIDGQKVTVRNCMAITPAKPGKYVMVKYNVPAQGSSAGAWLFVAASPTERMLVKRAEGNIVGVSKIGETTEFRVFFTVLGSNKPYAAYTAKDAANVSLEDG